MTRNSRGARRRAHSVACAAVVLSALSLLAVRFWVASMEAELRAVEGHVLETVRVAVALRDLHPAVPIAADDVGAMEIPVRALPLVRSADGGLGIADVFWGPELAVGHQPVERVLAGEILRVGRMADPRNGRGLNQALPIGMRAMSLPVRDAAAVGGHLMPGSLVDVIVHTDVEGGTRTETIEQAVFVVAVNGFANHGLRAAPSEGRVHPSVTEVVTPLQAARLAHAKHTGRLHLTLRGGDDVADRTLPGLASIVRPRFPKRMPGPLPVGSPDTIWWIRGPVAVQEPVPEPATPRR